jgi:hypothetical protein
MPEAISLGASLLGIAGAGIKIVTTLRTFAASYSSASSRINSLLAEVALTASILTALGNTVKEYEFELHLRVENFEHARGLVEGCFERLSAALKEAKKDEKMNWNGFGRRRSPSFAIG